MVNVSEHERSESGLVPLIWLSSYVQLARTAAIAAVSDGALVTTAAKASARRELSTDAHFKLRRSCFPPLRKSRTALAPLWGTLTKQLVATAAEAKIEIAKAHNIYRRPVRSKKPGDRSVPKPRALSWICAKPPLANPRLPPTMLLSCSWLAKTKLPVQPPRPEHGAAVQGSHDAVIRSMVAQLHAELIDQGSVVSAIVTASAFVVVSWSELAVAKEKAARATSLASVTEQERDTAAMETGQATAAAVKLRVQLRGKSTAISTAVNALIDMVVAAVLFSLWFRSYLGSGSCGLISPPARSIPGLLLSGGSQRGGASSVV